MKRFSVQGETREGADSSSVFWEDIIPELFYLRLSWLGLVVGDNVSPDRIAQPSTGVKWISISKPFSYVSSLAQ